MDYLDLDSAAKLLKLLKNPTKKAKTRYFIKDKEFTNKKVGAPAIGREETSNAGITSPHQLIANVQ